MAEFVLDDAFCSVAGTDLSDHMTEGTLDVSAELGQITAMGDDWHERLAGLKDWTASITFNQDFAAGSVDATLWAALGTAVTIIIRPVNAGGVGPTNPNFSGTAILEGYPPVAGSVGEPAKVQATFRGAGALQRLTA